MNSPYQSSKEKRLGLQTWQSQSPLLSPQQSWKSPSQAPVRQSQPPQQQPSVPKILAMENLLGRLCHDVDKLIHISTQHGTRIKELVVTAANSVSQVEFKSMIATTRFQHLNDVKSLKDETAAAASVDPIAAARKSIEDAREMNALRGQITDLRNEHYQKTFQSDLEVRKLQHELKIARKEYMELKNLTTALEKKLNMFVEDARNSGVNTTIAFTDFKRDAVQQVRKRSIVLVPEDKVLMELQAELAAEEKESSALQVADDKHATIEQSTDDEFALFISSPDKDGAKPGEDTLDSSGNSFLIGEQLMDDSLAISSVHSSPTHAATGASAVADSLLQRIGSIAPPLSPKHSDSKALNSAVHISPITTAMRMRKISSNPNTPINMASNGKHTEEHQISAFPPFNDQSAPEFFDRHLHIPPALLSQQHGAGATPWGRYAGQDQYPNGPVDGFSAVGVDQEMFSYAVGEYYMPPALAQQVLSIHTLREKFYYEQFTRLKELILKTTITAPITTSTVIDTNAAGDEQQVEEVVKDDSHNDNANDTEDAKIEDGDDDVDAESASAHRVSLPAERQATRLEVRQLNRNFYVNVMNVKSIESVSCNVAEQSIIAAINSVEEAAYEKFKNTLKDSEFARFALRTKKDYIRHADCQTELTGDVERRRRRRRHDSFSDSNTDSDSLSDDADSNDESYDTGTDAHDNNRNHLHKTVPKKQQQQQQEPMNAVVDMTGRRGSKKRKPGDENQPPTKKWNKRKATRRKSVVANATKKVMRKLRETHSPRATDKPLIGTEPVGHVSDDQVTADEERATSQDDNKDNQSIDSTELKENHKKKRSRKKSTAMASLTAVKSLALSGEERFEDLGEKLMLLPDLSTALMSTDGSNYDGSCATASGIAHESMAVIEPSPSTKLGGGTDMLSFLEEDFEDEDTLSFCSISESIGDFSNKYGSRSFSQKYSGINTSQRSGRYDNGAIPSTIAAVSAESDIVDERNDIQTNNASFKADGVRDEATRLEITSFKQEIRRMVDRKLLKLHDALFNRMRLYEMHNQMLTNHSNTISSKTNTLQEVGQKLLRDNQRLLEVEQAVAIRIGALDDRVKDTLKPVVRAIESCQANVEDLEGLIVNVSEAIARLQNGSTTTAAAAAAVRSKPTVKASRHVSTSGKRVVFSDDTADGHNDEETANDHNEIVPTVPPRTGRDLLPEFHKEQLPIEAILADTDCLVMQIETATGKDQIDQIGDGDCKKEEESNCNASNDDDPVTCADAVAADGEPPKECNDPDHDDHNRQAAAIRFTDSEDPGDIKAITNDIKGIDKPLHKSLMGFRPLISGAVPVSAMTEHEIEQLLRYMREYATLYDNMLINFDRLLRRFNELDRRETNFLIYGQKSSNAPSATRNNSNGRTTFSGSEGDDGQSITREELHTMIQHHFETRQDAILNNQEVLDMRKDVAILKAAVLRLRRAQSPPPGDLPQSKLPQRTASILRGKQSDSVPQSNGADISSRRASRKERTIKGIGKPPISCQSDVHKDDASNADGTLPILKTSTPDRLKNMFIDDSISLASQSVWPPDGEANGQEEDHHDSKPELLNETTTKEYATSTPTDAEEEVTSNVARSLMSSAGSNAAPIPNRLDFHLKARPDPSDNDNLDYLLMAETSTIVETPQFNQQQKGRRTTSGSGRKHIHAEDHAVQRRSGSIASSQVSSTGHHAVSGNTIGPTPPNTSRNRNSSSLDRRGSSGGKVGGSSGGIRRSKWGGVLNSQGRRIVKNANDNIDHDLKTSINPHTANAESREDVCPSPAAPVPDSPLIVRVGESAFGADDASSSSPIRTNDKNFNA